MHGKEFNMLAPYDTLIEQATVVNPTNKQTNICRSDVTIKMKMF